MGLDGKETTTMQKIKMLSAAVVLAGATIMIPSTIASAASMSAWDRLAQCESTGNWHINTGNGFHGGLQFTQQTWLGFGGGSFAPRADLASKSQQINIAERVLNTQGPGAWPICSVKAGL